MNRHFRLLKSVAAQLNPRSFVSLCLRQFRSSIVAKINFVQTLLVVYWLGVMASMESPRHDWTYALGGITLIQSLGLAARPGVPGPNGSTGLTILQLVFVSTLWVYAIYWSNVTSHRVRKWQMECQEYYAINLGVPHDRMVFQSMILTPLVLACQILIISAFSIPTGFEIYQTYQKEYEKLEHDPEALED